MRRIRRNSAVASALYVNAALLVVIVIVLLWRGNTPSFVPMAMAQNQAPIAGGAGVFIMPAQFSTNTWGCYLLDVDSQTLCAYQYYPGDKLLRLVAARNFRSDRRLNNYNTTPSPQEVTELVKKELRGSRGADGASTAPASPEAPAGQE
jgi:hypothetical protein